jgi:GAF domain-containing protein
MKVESTETGMELRDLLLDEEFLSRRKARRDPQGELEALRRLARVFADLPDIVLQELVDIAVDFCGADSAGISLEEPDGAGGFRFRWVAIAGSFSQYLNGTTPRFFSPCGTCLSSGRAQLYRVTKPYYDFLGVTAEEITDGMLIPWVNERMRGTIWAVAHHSREAFTPADYRLLESLADFASIAIRHQYQQEELRRREKAEASAARANEMAHQINNPLQSLTNAIYLAQQGGKNAAGYLKQAHEELVSLSQLVERLLESNSAVE